MPYQDPPQGASRYLSLPGVNKEKAMQWFSLGISEPQTYNQARLLAEAVGYSPEQSKVVAGQWQFESGAGSKIPSPYNYFGIKSHNEAVRNRLKERGINVSQGKEVETAEFKEGNKTKNKASFMEFSNAFEGFAAHRAFLETNARYKEALAAPTAKDFAVGLGKAGYATAPEYGTTLYNQYVAPKEKNPKSGDVRPKSFGPTKSSSTKPSAPVTTQGITGQDVMTTEEIQNLPLLAPQQIDFSTPVDKNPTRVKAMEDFEPYKQKVKPTESITFDAPKGWFGSGKTMFENGGAMNFKSKGAYQKWLAYGHASGEFARTPGNQKVSIKGEPHKVDHQYGGQMYADGGAMYDSMGNFYPDGGYTNTIGQAAQYGSMGYQAGSQFGPWGGLIGGLAGTIIGGVQGNQEDQAIADEEQRLADEQARREFEARQAGMAVQQDQAQAQALDPNSPTIFTPTSQYNMGGNLYDGGGDLWKALSRNARVYASPYSNEYSSVMQARNAKNYSKINYNDPAFNLGYEKRIQLSRDPKFKTSLGANVSLPYTGKIIPSVQGNFKGRYPLILNETPVDWGAMETQITAGYDPEKQFNASIVGNPRFEFSNIGQDKRTQDKYYKGDWSAYVGPTGGMGVHVAKGPTDNLELDTSLLYGIGAGFQAQPFRAPLRVGADVHYGFQASEGRSHDTNNLAVESRAGQEDGRRGLPSGRVYVSYPLDKLGRDAKRAANKIDWPEPKQELDITAPKFEINQPQFGGGVGRAESPKGFLPGYSPETGKKLSEKDVMNRYNYTPLVLADDGNDFKTEMNPSYKYGGSFNNPGFKALPSSVQSKIMNNSFAQGGTMDQLTEFNGGFKHEDPNILNTNSGIPQGMAPNGVPNIVEKGETKDKQGNYIFSDNIKVTKEIAQEFNLPSNYINKTFSEASKLANRTHSRRENDTIEANDTKRNLEKLTEAQETTKEVEFQKDLAMMQEKHPDFMNAMMAQQSYQPMGAPGGQMMEGQMPQEMMSGPQGMPIDPNQLPPEILAQMPEAQQGMPVMAYGGHMYKCGGKMYNFGGRMYADGGSVSEGGTTAIDGGEVMMVDNPEDTSTPNLGAQMGGAAAGLAGTLGTGLTSGNSTEDAINSTANTVIGMIPGYGQLHGVTNMAQQQIRAGLGDYNVNPITGEVSDTKTFKNEGEAGLDAWVRPQHEYISEAIGEGDWGKTAIATLLPGVSQLMAINDSNIGPVNEGIVTPKVNTSGRAVNQIATEQMPAEEAPLYMKYGGYTAQSPNHEFQQITPMYKDNAGPQGQPLTNLYEDGGEMYGEDRPLTKKEIIKQNREERRADRKAYYSNPYISTEDKAKLTLDRGLGIGYQIPKYIGYPFLNDRKQIGLSKQNPYNRALERADFDEGSINSKKDIITDAIRQKRSDRAEYFSNPDISFGKKVAKVGDNILGGIVDIPKYLAYPFLSDRKQIGLLDDNPYRISSGPKFVSPTQERGFFPTGFGMGGNMYSMGGRYLENGGPEFAFIPPTNAQMEAETYPDPYAQDFDWQGDWSPIMTEVSNRELAQQERDARERLLANDQLFLPEIQTEALNEMRVRGTESPGEYAARTNDISVKKDAEGNYLYKKVDSPVYGRTNNSFYPLSLEEEGKDKKGKSSKSGKKENPRDLRTHETLASTVADMLPGAYNLYQALQPLDTITPEDLYTKYSPEKVNYTQAENEARENYARMVNAAGQLGLSGGSRMGSLLAAAQQYDKEKGRILSEEENINKQLENQARQINSQQRTAAQKQAMDVNWKMKTQRQEHVKELASMAKNYFDAKRANELAEKYVAMSAPDLIGEDKWQVGHQGFLEYLKSQKDAEKKNKKA